MTVLQPKHGPHMVLWMGSSWNIINVRRVAPCQISYCWVYPLVPFPKNGQNMALLWPKHGPHMVLWIGCSWILIIVPRDVPSQISHCWVYPVATFLKMAKIRPFMAKTWVLIWSFKIGSFWILINVPRDVPCQISHCWVYPVAPFPGNGQNMAQIWSLHSPSNWFFLNPNQCAQRYSMPNFTLLRVSFSPLS